MTAYRPDIDGLRAIAVAVVILYHAGVPGFAGGYIGVDVFFVISGYLITRLLDSSSHLPAGEQLARFYLRRARRILPALIVVSLVVTAAACYVLLPLDLVRFSRYLGATPVFLTNVAARLNGSYFESELMPVALNHYWSIAVEEQFYLAYPALLLAAARILPQHRLPLVVLLAAGSFGLCLWASRYRPVASYYYSPMRAWELLLGAILALRAAAGGWAPRGVVAEVLAALGLAGIVLTAVMYDPTLEYPGFYALAPCGATAALIAAGQGASTRVGRLLSVRVLVFAGLVSYSLYLWHWPLLVLFRYWSIVDPGAPAIAALLMLTCLLAVLTWRFVESPVRSRAALPSSRSFVSAAVVGNLALLAIALALWKLDGWPQRFPQQVRSIASSRVPMHPDAARCMTIPPEKIRAAQLCRFGPPDATLPRVVVWGDSHALVLLPAYEELAWSHDVQLYFAASAACGPLLGVADTRRHRVGRMSCADFNEAAIEAIRALDPRLVILGGYWSYIEAGIEPEGAARSAAAESLFHRGLESSLHRISAQGRSLCVVLGVPTMRRVVPYAMAMTERRGVVDDVIGVTRADAVREYGSTESDIRALERLGLVETVDPKDALCASGRCESQLGGKPLYRDAHHLSVAGAKRVAPVVERCFAGIAGH